MSEIIKENAYVRFILDTEDEILFGYYKDNVNIGLNEAKQVVEDRLELQNGESYPGLVIMGKGFQGVTKEARDYLGNEGCRGLLALAIWTYSWMDKMIGNFFLNFSRPTVPTKLFNDPKEALSWLDKMKIKNKPKTGK